MIELGQVITAMVTPFKNDLSVDYDKAAELADHLIEHGSDGLVVSGTTGESPTLTDAEKIALFKTVKETIGKKGVVIAGTGNYNTAESIELTKEAEKVGVDACMLVVPYYSRPPQPGLFAHFRSVAESTDLPVILYNVPSRTGRNLEADTTIALSKVPNIIAVKEASGDLEQAAKIVQGSEEGFQVLSGDDIATLPMLSIGAIGVISVASHVCGEEIQTMISLYRAGNHTEALSVHLKLMPLFKVLFITTNPIMVKAACKLRGINAGGLRLPLVEATEAETDKLKKVMEDLDLV
jgi:4-hydroxy-tetrahydrodipicolinate synthase